MRSKVTTSDKSIDNAGIPSDYRLAIAEYIWNSFDAKASNVDIQFEANELGHISYFVISDNGEGINLSTIASTFGAFLDSQKQQSNVLLVDYQYYTLKTVEKWQNRFCVDTKNVRFNVFNFWLHQNHIDMDWMGAFEPTP